MIVALWLLALQGAIGAFDTIYYHEWRARLPARGRAAASELKLHAARDFLYAVLFASLPLIAWQGRWVLVLAAVIVAEIILTLTDFVVEIAVRRQLGDVYGGERVTHAIMGILYGAMTANLIPVMWQWWTRPTRLAPAGGEAPAALRAALLVMAVGVLLSGVRDLYAALEFPHGGWPWSAEPRAAAGRR
jgi:phosphatidylglycerophosphate synthase